MEEHQMPCWYYEKEELRNTPSFQVGIDLATESRYRNEGARFIIDCGRELSLRYETSATGVVFFHRFYMFHNFKDFPRFVTGACCLLLAGKVEETPKKCRDIVRTAKAKLTDNQYAQFGNNPKEEIITMERILLKTIKFDLQVSHPYKFLLQFVKKLKGDREKINTLAQVSWTFINDSLCTTLCLQWEPEIVACAVLYLATRLNKHPIDDWEGRASGQKWWQSCVEGMSIEVMEDICHQILDLYSHSKGGAAAGASAAALAAKQAGQGPPVSMTTGDVVTTVPAKKPKTEPPVTIDSSSNMTNNQFPYYTQHSTAASHTTSFQGSGPPPFPPFQDHQNNYKPGQMINQFGGVNPPYLPPGHPGFYPQQPGGYGHPPQGTAPPPAGWFAPQAAGFPPPAGPNPAVNRQPQPSPQNPSQITGTSKNIRTLVG